MGSILVEKLRRNAFTKAFQVVSHFNYEVFGRFAKIFLYRMIRPKTVFCRSRHYLRRCDQFSECGSSGGLLRTYRM
ncbi:hypothetical protein C4Q31_18850 [Leptospira borgpetersenii serovar Ceylonica]|nr:hypothetical protein C4Q31_18850 [Leptospira borgpetersenii serovar Ceylonica]